MQEDYDTVYNYALKIIKKLGVDIKTQVTVDYGTKRILKMDFLKNTYNCGFSTMCWREWKIEGS